MNPYAAYPTHATPITAEALEAILRAHEAWKAGNGGKRADLRGVDLRAFDFRGARLSGADLRCADLRGVNLSGAFLHNACGVATDLRRALLEGADFTDANLTGANLLDKPGLRSACLQGACTAGALGIY